LVALNGNQDVKVLQPIVASSRRVIKLLHYFDKTVRMMHVHLYRRGADFVNQKSLENYFIWKFYWFFVEERGPDGKIQDIGFIPLDSFSFFFN
jgi:hypothetical protein